MSCQPELLPAALDFAGGAPYVRRAGPRDGQTVFPGAGADLARELDGLREGADRLPMLEMERHILTPFMPKAGGVSWRSSAV